MSQTCKYCHKPTAECLKADKKLMTPLNLANINQLDKPFKPDSRSELAVKYVLGCYDPDSNHVFWYHSDNVSTRTIHDTYLALPMCVWEDYHGLRSRQAVTECVCNNNLRILPIDSEFITILESLSSYEF